MSKDDLVQMFKRRSRHPLRPRSSDIVAHVFSNFKRYPETGGALIAGETDFQDHRLVVIGQEKPKPAQLSSKSALKKLNWGMLNADEHSMIMSIMKRAKSKDPERTIILTLIDTYGADISMYSAERLQAFFIAHLIREFLTIPIPTMSIVIGEGGSGGALAIQYTDRRAQLDDAIYATAPPESLAAIIFRDPNKIEEALSLLKPTARDLKMRGVIDTILPSPKRVNDVAGFASSIEAYISRTVKELSKAKIKKLLKARMERAETFGQPRRGKLSGLWETLEKPIVERFAKPSPDAKVIRFSSLTEVSEDYRAEGAPDPDNDYIRCGDSPTRGGSEGCGNLVKLKEFIENHYICPHCGVAEVLSAAGWLDCLTDPGSVHELNRNLSVDDIFDERDIPEGYPQFLRRQAKRSPFKESLVTAQAKIYKMPVIIAASEFNFSGGSMGVVFGEKFKLAADYAIANNMPVISICCSGGARLYEGISALMQMVKTIAAVQRLKEAGLLYLSILGDPATGGAVASYAAVGDVTISEPNALISFTGPRVMKSRGFDIDETKIRSDSLQDISACVYDRPEYFHTVRGINEVAPRRKLKRVVAKYLEVFNATRPIC